MTYTLADKLELDGRFLGFSVCSKCGADHVRDMPIAADTQEELFLDVCGKCNPDGDEPTYDM